MAKLYDESLFEDTKMTFGEHLEELRVSLFRAVIGLIVGFLVGLFFADRVVAFIESPLKRALEDYYRVSNVMDLEAQKGEKIPEAMIDFMIEHHVVSDEVFVEAAEIQRLSGNLARQVSDEDAAPSSSDISGDSAKEGGPSTPKAAGSRDDDPKTKGADNTAENSTDDKAGGEPTPDDQAMNEPTAIPDGTGMLKLRIWKPMNTEVTSLSAQEPFMIWLKAGMVVGLIFSSPWVFWQVWLFVAAGLYPHERRYVHIYVPFSIGLFLAGAAMAFFFVFDPVLSFLFSFNRMMDIDPDPRISEWISFVLILPLGFGISFQLPLVMLFLNRIGIFSVRAYLEKWRIAIMAIFVISMILTPADPISMLLMAVPLTVLYFLGVGLCVWMPRGRNPFSEAYDP